MERELIVLSREEAEAAAREIATNAGVRDNEARILDVLLRHGQVEEVTVQ